jgi:hypothetical protein
MTDKPDEKRSKLYPLWLVVAPIIGAFVTFWQSFGASGRNDPPRDGESETVSGHCRGSFRRQPSFATRLLRWLIQLANARPTEPARVGGNRHN